MTKLNPNNLIFKDGKFVLANEDILTFNQQQDQKQAEIEKLKQQIYNIYLQNNSLREQSEESKKLFANQDIVKYTRQIVDSFTGKKETIEKITQNRKNPLFYSSDSEVSKVRCLEQLVYFKQTLQQILNLYTEQINDYEQATKRLGNDCEFNQQTLKVLTKELSEHQKELNLDFVNIPFISQTDSGQNLSHKHSMEQQMLQHQQQLEIQALEHSSKQLNANKNIQLFMDVQTHIMQYQQYIQSISQNIKIIHQSQYHRLLQLTQTDKVVSYLHDQIQNADNLINSSHYGQMNILAAKQLCQVLLAGLQKENIQVLERHSDCFSWMDNLMEQQRQKQINENDEQQ